MHSVARPGDTPPRARARLAGSLHRQGCLPERAVPDPSSRHKPLASNQGVSHLAAPSACGRAVVAQASGVLYSCPTGEIRKRQMNSSLLRMSIHPHPWHTTPRPLRPASSSSPPTERNDDEAGAGRPPTPAVVSLLVRTYEVGGCPASPGWIPLCAPTTTHAASCLASPACPLNGGAACRGVAAPPDPRPWQTRGASGGLACGGMDDRCSVPHLQSRGGLGTGLGHQVVNLRCSGTRANWNTLANCCLGHSRGTARGRRRGQTVAP